MTPRNDLLDHAVDLFPVPEGSVAEVERDVARRHRNRRLAAVSVVVGIWVVIGIVAVSLRSRGDSTPIQPPVVPSPTIAPGSVDAQGWVTTRKNRDGVYSWGSGCLLESDEKSCIEGFMHNAYAPGSGKVSIFISGEAGQIEPHEGTPVTVFGYDGTLLGDVGDPIGIPGTPCDQWMVDIHGTTVTLKLCAKDTAPEAEVAEAQEIIDTIRVESPADNDYGFRLILTIPTGTWDSG